jgi:acylphosphatase
MTASREKQAVDRRMTIRFEGRVQGVGFRYTAIRHAEGFDISGFVQNEPDGSVTVVDEGAEADLLRFVQTLKSSHLGRYVTRELISWSPATGEFGGFSIGYGQ